MKKFRILTLAVFALLMLPDGSRTALAGTMRLTGNEIPEQTGERKIRR